MHNHLKIKSVARDRILAESKKLIVEEGICSFRLSQLPAKCQCSTKTFYQYFKSREDIVSALFIEHMNDYIDKIDIILSMEELSLKEKVIYSHMYDVVKCWSAREGDVCINFIGVNPHVYGVSSAEYEGNINVVFIELKNRVQALWSQALNSGALLSDKTDIVNCIFSIRTIERGSIVVGQNKFLRQHGHDSNIESVFNLLSLMINSLKWRDEQPLSFSKMLTTLSPLVKTAAGSSFKHCKLNYDTLNDPIEL
ncbi:TetR/AcrR family transcriptional regulator [Shewanella youngdeokensis]|uniref:TetR/AcrR family transcriptional regulator n=1 Tax=Shewanella youngdeokensis TaxID=2999068 RepID=A0ABZ0JTD5_9GAMM|nr:TetR/AcrR family transcriptional regulator [Shewanella sp. DAU334]